MPEIAEVESVSRVLNAVYKGKTLTSVDFKTNTHVKGLPRGINTINFDSIAGYKISNIDRIGKNIVFNFDNNYHLISHLMMSGVWLIGDNLQNLKHQYLTLTFDNASILSYYDQRRFGILKVLHNQDLGNIKKGLDPMGDDFSLSRFVELMKNSYTLKRFLLERQDKIVGIGNIYCCEILREAKLSPFRLCCDLNRQELESLYTAIVSVILLAVKNGGSTLGDKGYILPDGTFGTAQNLHVVYNKQYCSCGIKINRIIQNGRSTFYCPVCQV